MSICLTRFPISGLGKPKLYQNMWCFTSIRNFTLRVVSMDWITGGDFGKKFRRISKEDKLNYKI